MRNATAIQRIETVYDALAPVMDERMRRQWAAAEAQAYGWGGSHAISTAIGMSMNTVRRGLQELAERAAHPEVEVSARVRQVGGGRKRQTELDPDLPAALERLIEPATRGDPESPLRWTCKSTTRLASELTAAGHPVSASTVGRLLRAADYSLQSNRKAKEGADHPDRNAQFEHIAATVQSFQQRGQPVISVDTKKKELTRTCVTAVGAGVGEFRMAGQEWQPKGEPVEVLIHDFIDKDLGKAIPYGVYDLTANEGWVSVGIDHDTARFATEAIRRWWQKMGVKAYGQARELLTPAPTAGAVLRPMGAAATAAAAGCGKWRCKTWRWLWVFRFKYATSRRAPANGTRLSIGCSVTSPRTGVADRW